ncbi:MAG: VTT domain-containing protein [Pseudomonadota bacterium]|nr:VTT domain-containing protein [Pseudomonadota bacterium]
MAGTAWWLHHSGMDVDELLTIVRAEPLALGQVPTAMLYLVAAVLRPFLFIPTTVVVVGAGLLFGPWIGLPVAVAGLALGATSSWAVGRWVTEGGGDLPRSLAPLAVTAEGPWAGLEGVCAARLANLPCDAVSFSAGCLGTPYPGFLLGTMIGSFPSVAVLALAGGALSAGQNLRFVLAGVAAGLLLALLAWSRTAALRKARMRKK